MESLSDVTQSMEENDSSGEENNEENIEKSIPYLKKLHKDEKLQKSTSNCKPIIESDILNSKFHKLGKLKFLERPAHPDDCILVQLASRVYHEKPNGNDLRNRELPKDWKLLMTAYNTEIGNGYFGAAYWNPEQQQIVVAHRGTAFTNTGALWTDIRGILYNNYVPQMASAITFAHKIKVMVEELNKGDNVFLQLSFTGHSLGGWLAQITTLTTKYFGLKNVAGNYSFVKSKKVGYHAHTVVFDSPGCKEMLSKIQDCYELRHDIDRYGISIYDLDITTYLSAPNLVNTCNLHAGTLYRVFIKYQPGLSFSDFGIYTLKMHSIESIKEALTEDKINETQKVIDWPLIDKRITRKALKKLIKKTPKLIKRVLFTLIGGKPLPVNNEYKYFHLLAEGNDYNPKPDDKEGYCEIRYQLQKVDKTKCSMNIFSQPELDFLTLYQVFRETRGKKLKNVFTSIGDKAAEVENTLKNFKIEKRVEIIRCNSEDELRKLICYVKYTIRFLPKITNRIERTLQNEPIWFEIKKLVRLFIGRTEQLGWTYSQINRAIVVITGLDGVGKSELTIKYVHEYYSDDNSVVWIDAENEETIKKSFISLYKELNLIRLNTHEEEDTGLVMKRVYEYLNDNSKKIFIFDNAENYTAIEKFLPQKLCQKVHVVVTSSNSLEWTSKRREVKAITLKEFLDEEAIQFVKEYLNISPTDDLQDKKINSLIQALHNFPLALQQAVAYIQMMKEEGRDLNLEYKISDYLTKYEQEPRTVLGAGLESEDRNGGVLSTLNMIINKIKASEEFGQQALNILDTISFFAPSNIPNEIFLNKFTSVDELLLIIQQLTKYSIVCKKNGMLNVHGLVQQIRKLEVEEENREEETLKSALLLITEHIAVREHNKHETNPEKKEREKIELWTPHVVSVWNHAYKYINLIEEFLLRGRQIKIPRSDMELSVMYFHFIAAGSRFEIVEKIITEIEKMHFNNREEVKNFINAGNNDKESALHCAAQNNMEKTVKLLVSKGADVNAKNKYGWTPLDLAEKNKHLSIAKYLRENGDEIEIHRTSTVRSLTFEGAVENVRYLETSL